MVVFGVAVPECYFDALGCFVVGGCFVVVVVGVDGFVDAVSCGEVGGGCFGG